MNDQVQATTTTHRARFGALRLAAAIGLSAAAVFGIASPALAHDELIDQVITASDSGEAAAVRLTFSDKVLAAGSNEIRVTDSKGTSVIKGVVKLDLNDAVQPLNAPLADGEYLGVWHVVSSDGHPIEGAFSFTVADAKSNDMVKLDISEASKRLAAQKGEATPAETQGDAHGEGAEDHSHEGNENAAGNSWVLPVAIGGGVLFAAAVAVPLLVKMRRNAAITHKNNTSTEKE